MLLQIITFYVVCDDFLIAMGHKEDPQATVVTAEVMTAALVAAWFFAGNQSLACTYLRETGLIPAMPSKSRFNRRLHQIPASYWTAVLKQFAQDGEDTYIVDSCPIPVCAYVRSKRCRLYRDAAYYGYCASKELHFYGLKCHAIVTQTGKPVEIELLPGCSADLVGLKEMQLQLPPGSKLCADKAYNHYAYEDKLASDRDLHLLPQRKRNSKRAHSNELAGWINRVRKRIETTFSQVTARLGRKIHAVIPAGFELKIRLVFAAYAIVG